MIWLHKPDVWMLENPKCMDTVSKWFTTQIIHTNTKIMYSRSKKILASGQKTSAHKLNVATFHESWPKCSKWVNWECIIKWVIRIRESICNNISEDCAVIGISLGQNNYRRWLVFSLVLLFTNRPCLNKAKRWSHIDLKARNVGEDFVSFIYRGPLFKIVCGIHFLGTDSGARGTFLILSMKRGKAIIRNWPMPRFATSSRAYARSTFHEANSHNELKRTEMREKMENTIHRAVKR